MTHAQKKGKAGEKEICKWFEKNVYKNLDEPLQRNMLQADGKGSDIHLPDFIVEVKRREALDLQSWWNQVLFVWRKIKNKDKIPVVAFRQNRNNWEFLIPAKLIGLEKGYLRLNENTFKEFANNIVDEFSGHSPSCFIRDEMEDSHCDCK